MKSPRGSSEIAAQSLRNRLAIAEQWICDGFGIGTVALRMFRKNCLIAAQSLRYCNEISSNSLCDRFEIAL
jgi:hypothetical protein